MSAWYRERGALAFIGKRYLPLFALFNVLWEFAQLPLYTIWREASPGSIAFAVAHCTAGDVPIGAAALALALAATRAGPIGCARCGNTRRSCRRSAWAGYGSDSRRCCSG